MKTTNNETTAIDSGSVSLQTTEAKSGFYESLFRKAMGNAKEGQMSVLIPGGRSFTLGEAKPGKQNAVLEVKDVHFFQHAVLYGEIGFGETYMEGMIDSPDMLKVLRWFVDNAVATPGFAAAGKKLFVNILGIANKIRHTLRPNTVKIARKNIAEHYDLSNEMYEYMLGSSMAYSSGLFLTGKEDLKTAQENKFESLCQKLQLKPGLHMLEIGSGWAGFAIYAAKKYGVKITTITISEKQFDYCKKRIEEENLQSLIELKLIDYRHIDGQYDRIVSIEMVEALGFRYFDTYFGKMASLLKKDGLMAIQAITMPDTRFSNYIKGESDFIQKHIFPGSCLLSQNEITRSLLRTSDLNIYHSESMAMSYTRTLAEWRKNFNENIEEIRKMGFSERFIRKWNYYLLYCEAGFGSRYINVIQLLFSRPQNTQLQDFHGLKNQ